MFRSKFKVVLFLVGILLLGGVLLSWYFSSGERRGVRVRLYHVGESKYASYDAAKEVLDSVLNDWIKGDYVSLRQHWLEENTYQPLQDLSSIDHQLGLPDQEDPNSFAFTVILHFKKSARYPSGDLWTFELKKVDEIWKIVSYRWTNL